MESFLSIICWWSRSKGLGKAQLSLASIVTAGNPSRFAENSTRGSAVASHAEELSTQPSDLGSAVSLPVCCLGRASWPPLRAVRGSSACSFCDGCAERGRHLVKLGFADDE